MLFSADSQVNLGLNRPDTLFFSSHFSSSPIVKCGSKSSPAW